MKYLFNLEYRYRVWDWVFLGGASVVKALRSGCEVDACDLCSYLYCAEDIKLEVPAGIV